MGKESEIVSLTAGYTSVYLSRNKQNLLAQKILKGKPPKLSNIIFCHKSVVFLRDYKIYNSFLVSRLWESSEALTDEHSKSKFAGMSLVVYGGDEL